MIPHIELHCPHCGHGLSVRSEYLGHRVRCRHCNNAFHAQLDVTDDPGSGEFPVVPSNEFPTVTHAPPARPDTPAIRGYEPLGLIRTGSMGQVFKARQTSVDRVVAIKVLSRERVSDVEFVERFHREAAAAARLAHTNIPHLIDAGTVDGRPYLVMDYADGETAQERLDAHGAFPEATAVAVALGVAQALDHVHRRGLIHRDVKPSNLILTTEGGVKLIDFGLARPVSDEAWAAAEAGNAIGTPEYISPEQTRGQADLDPRSDFYSLGATLYHLVTARAPYSGTSREILRKHADPRARPTPPADLNPALSPGLVAVIDRLMSKNRESRYARPVDLIDDLYRVLRGDGTSGKRT